MKLSDAITFGTRLYYNRYEDDRRVTFSDLPTGNLPRQRIWDERQHGLLSTLTWQASPTLTVEGGLNYEQQDNGYLRDAAYAALATASTSANCRPSTSPSRPGRSCRPIVSIASVAART